MCLSTILPLLLPLQAAQTLKLRKQPTWLLLQGHRKIRRRLKTSGGTLLAWALQTPMLPQHRETLYQRTQQITRLRQRRDRTALIQPVTLLV